MRPIPQGLPVVIPRAMGARKPPHGAPCNRCGVCCYATLCDLGQHVFRQELGPCPALAKDEAGEWACGLVEEPTRHATRLSIVHGWRKMREAARWLIGSGTGCDARINGEPVNAAFNASLEVWDHVHADAVAAARKLWGMP